MRFLLSIHDVWPGNYPMVADYLTRLRSLGARRIALLVVPAFHGCAPMEENPEFLSWLREESGRGTELFLHGYHHLMAELVETPGRNMGRNAWGRFVNGRLVLQEAEFCGLPDAEGERLLRMGLASWGRTGLPLAGFVAPTWHGAPPERALREAGIPIWETRFRVKRLVDGKTRFAPPIAWDLSAPDGEPRLFGGMAWFKALTALSLIKVAIHPGDFESQAAIPLLERVFTTGTDIAYADVFGAGTLAVPFSAGPGNRSATSGRKA
jgi:uncharacterized protein